MIFFTKTKKYFSFFLPFVFLFQWTLPTTEKKRNTQIHFGELILVKCNNPEHSHPPLSENKSSHEVVKFVTSEGNNLFFVSTPPKLFYTSGEKKLKKFTTFPKSSQTQFLTARGPPNFEV